MALGLALPASGPGSPGLRPRLHVQWLRAVGKRRGLCDSASLSADRRSPRTHALGVGGGHAGGTGVVIHCRTQAGATRAGETFLSVGKCGPRGCWARARSRLL